VRLASGTALPARAYSSYSLKVELRITTYWSRPQSNTWPDWSFRTNRELKIEVIWSPKCRCRSFDFSQPTPKLSVQMHSNERANWCLLVKSPATPDANYWRAFRDRVRTIDSSSNHSASRGTFTI